MTSGWNKARLVRQGELLNPQCSVSFVSQNGAGGTLLVLPKYGNCSQRSLLLLFECLLVMSPK